MKIKDILAISILAAFVWIITISWPVIKYWIHSNESVVTIKVVLILGMVLTLIGLCAANASRIYHMVKEKEFFDEVADKVESRKIEMPEMRANAESALNYDQQAHLRMLRNNPHFKIDTKV